jgi:hypothetical protein
MSGDARDLGDTLLTPPPGGRDLRPLDEHFQIRLRPGVAETLQRLSQLGMT